MYVRIEINGEKYFVPNGKNLVPLDQRFKQIIITGELIFNLDNVA